MSEVLVYHLHFTVAFQIPDVIINRIRGKSVHARAFAHERLQHTVSYIGIDMFSCTILKTMYRKISNSTFNNESRSHTTRFRSGTESNLAAAQDKSCTPQFMPASNKMILVRWVSNRWMQSENPGENHWTIGCYDWSLVSLIAYIYEMLARTYDRTYNGTYNRIYDSS